MSSATAFVLSEPQDLSEGEEQIIETVVGICAGLSLFAEVLLILSFILVKEIRTFSMKLVLSLIIGDFIYEISNMMNFFRSNQVICETSVYIRLFGISSSTIWAVLIT